MIHMKTIGIIGFGSFGKFLAEKLSSHAKVMVYGQGEQQNSWSASLEDVARADYVVLAVPLDAYEAVLGLLKPYLRPETVIVDVCSVKVRPVEMIRRVMPTQPLVITHPMFGPESASVSFAGLTLVMCPEHSEETAYQRIKQFAESLGLAVVEISADDHDREIAVVQGLTFFVARALNETGIRDQLLHTPTFSQLLAVGDVEKHHSWELFQTIQLGNAHTQAVRERFIDVATKINQDLQLIDTHDDSE